MSSESAAALRGVTFPTLDCVEYLISASQRLFSSKKNSQRYKATTCTNVWSLPSWALVPLLAEFAPVGEERRDMVKAHGSYISGTASATGVFLNQTSGRPEKQGYAPADIQGLPFLQMREAASQVWLSWLIFAPFTVLPHFT